AGLPQRVYRILAARASPLRWRRIPPEGRALPRFATGKTARITGSLFTLRCSSRFPIPCSVCFVSAYLVTAVLPAHRPLERQHDDVVGVGTGVALATGRIEAGDLAFYQALDEGSGVSVIAADAVGMHDDDALHLPPRRHAKDGVEHRPARVVRTASFLQEP